MPNLYQTQIREGVWRSRVEGVSAGADIQINIRGQFLRHITVEEEEGMLSSVSVPVPSDYLSEGTNTFVVIADGETVGSFTIICGDLVEDDIRAEVGVLREEIDLLKKALRRLARETISEDVA